MIAKLRALFQKRRLEEEMAEEMRFHLEQRAADGREDGLGAEEARLAALRKFGNVGSIQEKARDARGWRRLESFGRDLRLGLRSLAKSPGFTLLAVLTLGLGVGANTAMFSVLNEIALRPLPYPDSFKLDRVFRVNAQKQDGGVSPADYLTVPAELEGYGRLAGYTRGSFSLAESGRPAELASAASVSANFFSVLGVQPQLGRDFRPEEAVQGRHRVVLLSRRTWLHRFGGAADIVGRAVRVDGESHEVIGVLPASFNDWRHFGDVDLFRPYGFTPADSAERAKTTVQLIGRRLPGIPATDAEGRIAAVGNRLAQESPAFNAGTAWRTSLLEETEVNSSRTLAMLVGLSGFVLLIACSNLANFLLARTMTRAREFAVRAALGASRLQLLRPLVVESLLLSLAGAVCAVLVTLWFGHWLSVRSTGDNGERVLFEVDWRVLSWALLASLGTAVAFGLAPALFAMRLDLNRTLKSGARGTTGGPAQERLRRLLIVGQFALAMVLLAGAALFGRGLEQANNRRAGWESEQLLTGTLLLPPGEFPGTAEIAAFQRLAVERLEALPGVRSASLSYAMPFFGLSEPRKYVVDGREAPKPGLEPSAVINGVSPRYFETVGTRVLKGRVFTAADHLAAPRVFIISQSMAAGLFGQDDPLGRRLTQFGTNPPVTGEIVGVVADIQSVFPDRKPVANQLYQPLAQEGRPLNELAVRAAGVAPAAVIDAVRSTMAEIAPDLPVRRLQAADARINRANYQNAVLRDMLILFAALGLSLASLGIYGVIARTMAARAGEFSIRLALGAKVRDITRLVLASGVKLAVLGAAFGLVGAVGISRLLAAGYPGMQFDIGPVLGAVTCVLVLVALLASYLPARRAAGINPIEALRSE